MKLENQVSTLAQSQRLKELGVENNSQGERFYWSDESKPHTPPDYKVKLNSFVTSKGGVAIEYYSAYTVAELGVMLPLQAYSLKYDDGINWGMTVQSPLCLGIPDSHDIHVFKQYDTEAQARAAMLIYLLENGLITADEVNQRLSNDKSK